MKDFLDRLNEVFDSVYDTVTGKIRDSGNPDLDRAWSELDEDLSKGRFSMPRSGFDDLDRDFAEFDRKFSEARGFKEDFDRLKDEARREQRDSRESGGYRHTADDREARDPVREKARELVRDYHNLEVKPGADAETVRAAYKRLLMQYHPDRFGTDAEKQKTATQITARLNDSYKRIMEFLGAR